MKAKKIYFIVIGILLIILAIIIWSYINSDEEVIEKKNEIVPQEEISDQQLRNTMISLYYINKENSEIEVENKLIDAKQLLRNPYEYLVNIWLTGSSNNKLKTNCSQNVKVNKVELVGDCAVVDFSKEFVDEYAGTDEEISKVIYCIVNTLTELTEVNCVKILIDGGEDVNLGAFNLSEMYYRLEN